MYWLGRFVKLFEHLILRVLMHILKMTLPKIKLSV